MQTYIYIKLANNQISVPKQIIPIICTWALCSIKLQSYLIKKLCYTFGSVGPRFAFALTPIERVNKLYTVCVCVSEWECWWYIYCERVCVCVCGAIPPKIRKILPFEYPVRWASFVNNIIGCNQNAATMSTLCFATFEY